MMKLFTSTLIFLGWTVPVVVAQCGLCPGGFGPRRPGGEFGEYEGQVVTCGELHLILQNIPDPVCEEAQDAAMMVNPYRVQCGYCDVPDDAVGLCQLCADGSSPGRMAGFVLPDGEDCGTKHYLALREEPGSLECDAYQVFGFQCGCPTPAPITEAPATAAPVTAAPVTPAPIPPSAPVTPAPVTVAPVTPAPMDTAPVAPPPTTDAPTTDPPVMPTTDAPVTAPPTTDPPTTSGSSFAKHVSSSMILGVAAYIMMV